MNRPSFNIFKPQQCSLNLVAGVLCSNLDLTKTPVYSRFSSLYDVYVYTVVCHIAPNERIAYNAKTIIVFTRKRTQNGLTDTLERTLVLNRTSDRHCIPDNKPWFFIIDLNRYGRLQPWVFVISNHKSLFAKPMRFQHSVSRGRRTTGLQLFARPLGQSFKLLSTRRMWRWVMLLARGKVLF